MLFPFSPQPAPAELPGRFPDPFSVPPHPLAARAAIALQGRLARGEVKLPNGLGKMFGVLVVADARGHTGYLQAFSGLISDSWELPGFVPGTCDTEEKERVWAPRVGRLKEMSERIDALEQGEEARLRNALVSLTAERAQALEALKISHAARKQSRALLRARLSTGDGHHSLVALNMQSRADCAEERELRQSFAARSRSLRATLEVAVQQRKRLEAERRDRCNEALHAVQDTYVMQSASGARKSLKELFGARNIPGGAGDCAGPKLLFYAHRNHLRPLALAEFWWGAPPKAADREAGCFYPACQDKCGVLLPFMLEGLALEA